MPRETARGQIPSCAHKAILRAPPQPVASPAGWAPGPPSRHAPAMDARQATARKPLFELSAPQPPEPASSLCPALSPVKAPSVAKKAPSMPVRRPSWALSGATMPRKGTRVPVKGLTFPLGAPTLRQKGARLPLGGATLPLEGPCTAKKTAASASRWGVVGRSRGIGGEKSGIVAARSGNAGRSRGTVAPKRGSTAGPGETPRPGGRRRACPDVAGSAAGNAQASRGRRTGPPQDGDHTAAPSSGTSRLPSSWQRRQAMTNMPCRV